MSALYSLGAKEANEGRNNKTKNTFTTIVSKKAAALAKAEHEYNVAVGKNPENQEELEQQLRDAKQAAQDAFEEQIEAAGGSVKHFEYSNVPAPKPAPSAASQPQANQAVPPATFTVPPLMPRQSTAAKKPVKGDKQTLEGVEYTFDGTRWVKGR